ncbi:MAG: InlB B-repeat-containing protein [Treponema sp.]|jgi:uncharacterized repeat protein (TIGR02543 family)|nr:InlB B-repeat-containing protein [Treponema sp.]
MKNKIFLLPLALVSIAVLIVPGCSLEGEAEIIKKNSCTITFNTAGASGAGPADITVSRGGAMGDKYPLDPVNDPFVFYGWWDSGIRYEQDSVINADLDLTARWARTEDMVTITFNADGGTAVPPLKVIKDEPIGLRIPVSRKKNYPFDGWFVSSVQYTAEAPVISGAITLTAKWTIKATHTVSFNTVDKIADPNAQQCTVAAIQVYDGEGLEESLPGATHTDNRIKFVRWIGAANELYDEFTPIYEDMTFYAKWGLDPYVVDLSAVSITNNGGASNYNAAYHVDTESIKNDTMYDGGASRWEIMYRISLNLPGDFDMGYYTRYTVRARFFGNKRAILGDPDYASGYMNAANAIQAVGDEMPPKAGYGQISWSNVLTDNGNPGNAAGTVIAQQYNLGTSTVNQQWQVGGHYTGDPELAKRPAVLLIQTSDNWIGWIEIYEIAFHNGEAEFQDAPEAEGP